MSEKQQPVTPEMLDAGAKAREGWLRFQDILLDKVAAAEAAAEEARQELERAKIHANEDREAWFERCALLVVENKSFREHYGEMGSRVMENIVSLRADLAEARQERDDLLHDIGLRNARIQTLEAALRRIADWDSKHLQVPEPGFPAQIALQMQDEARAALQPTQEPGEVTPAT